MANNPELISTGTVKTVSADKQSPVLDMPRSSPARPTC